jgi:hypothetical protein
MIRDDCPYARAVLTYIREDILKVLEILGLRLTFHVDQLGQDSHYTGVVLLRHRDCGTSRRTRLLTSTRIFDTDLTDLQLTGVSHRHQLGHCYEQHES